MKKITYLILGVILVVAIVTFYIISSPFTIQSVKVVESVGQYTKVDEISLSGYQITGEIGSYIEKCRYMSYDPQPGLDNVYICKAKGDINKALESWVDKDQKALTTSFLEGEIEIAGVRVRTVTIAEKHCGNPGFCTSYFWKQGRVLFSTPTLPLVEAYINEN